MQQAQEYGSINRSEDNDEEIAEKNEEEDQEFDWRNTYYLDEEKGKKCNYVKMFLAGFPVLIAVLLIGGIMYLLQDHFHFFYPSAGGGGVDSGGSSSSSSSGGESFLPSVFDQPTSGGEDSHSKSSLCVEYLGCMELSGYCCPTSEGTYLACCEE